ncbi:MAG TPA: glycosyltransferase family 1 protein, partial [Gammaproteobacteria bacterium]|nr:glycosyltransferase family 1 protein [Gammaproteobacteria bacterium]
MKRSRLTFYAPLKAPDHSHPSGDRRMAALLMQALQLADYDVVLASRFRSYDHVGDPLRQSRIHHLGQALAGRLLRHYVRTGDAPDFWFTYHLYHKAPDWIGPQVAQALQIPYIVAEASLAPKQVDGNWASGHQAVAHALLRTDLVVHLNPDDETCVTPLLGARASSLNLAPFMDLGPLPDPKERNKLRRQLTFEQGIDPGSFWLVCTAMMRPGDKFSSYRMLAHSLRSLLDLPWRLLVIGDGKCRDQVKSLFVDIDQRCCWLGQCEHETVLEILTASDLYLWPGINEAYGLALL